jgi:hypothetical protein
VQLPRQFENECQKIRQGQFFMTFRRVNLGVFSAPTRIFKKCDAFLPWRRLTGAISWQTAILAAQMDKSSFLDSSFSSQENGKTSRLCPPDSSSS